MATIAVTYPQLVTRLHTSDNVRIKTAEGIKNVFTVVTLVRNPNRVRVYFSPDVYIDYPKSATWHVVS